MSGFLSAGAMAAQRIVKQTDLDEWARQSSGISVPSKQGPSRGVWDMDDRGDVDARIIE